MNGQRAYGPIERKKKKRTWQRQNSGKISKKVAVAHQNRLRSLRMRGEIPVE